MFPSERIQRFACRSCCQHILVPSTGRKTSWSHCLQTLGSAHGVARVLGLFGSETIQIKGTILPCCSPSLIYPLLHLFLLPPASSLLLPLSLFLLSHSPILSRSIFFLPPTLIAFLYSSRTCHSTIALSDPVCLQITNQLLMSWQDKYCRVESLDIRGCHRLDSATISFVLANSPGLRKFVGVGLATIMVSALSVLAESCPNLTHLDLSCCSNVTGSGLSILAKGCPNLEYLGLRGFSTSQRFSHFTKADIPLLKLKHLDISSSQIGLLDLKHMKTENFPELGRLDMFFCSSVANMAVDYISQNFINLWYLDISMCLNVSDDGLTSIATSPLASTLQYLDIGGCNRVTERGIEVMALCCSQLRWLYIDDNNNVNDDCLQAIGGNMKHLKRVDFTHDTKVSDVGVAALAQGCPNLRYLTLTETQATLEGCQQMFGEGVKIKF
eukprot:TRINITY_DN1736_c0_g1_i3.p1 TRINITY_DN1736_c0_g1~~TRINITY_DN1736_c0_g1_i3.p1  ORF type:complete len:474 (+),score=58.71 TRINITY_DN1736_c0_g1_i3:102-1424(+)